MSAWNRQPKGQLALWAVTREDGSNGYEVRSGQAPWCAEAARPRLLASAVLVVGRTVFGMQEMFRDGPHFGFRLRDPARLDDAIATVEAAGGRLLERGAHSSDQAFAYVCDPDGYVIEL